MKFLKRSKPASPQGTMRRMRSTSSASPVFSYYSGQRRATPGQPTQHNRGEVAPKQRRVAFQFRHIPTYIALFMLGSAFLYVLTLSSDPRVVLEQQPGVVQRDSTVYSTEVRQMWRKSVFNLTKITANTDKTRSDILNQYHELADVRVQLPLVGRRPTIVLVPAAPALQLQAQNGVFYLDSNGKALVDTSYVKTTSDVPTLSDDSVLAVEPGKQVLAQSQTSYVIQLYKELKSASVPVQSLTLSANSVNEIDLRTSDQGYYVKFQMTSDSEVRQAVGAYMAARKKFDADGTKPAEYVDVRVPEKVFYK